MPQVYRKKEEINTFGFETETFKYSMTKSQMSAQNTTENKNEDSVNKARVNNNQGNGLSIVLLEICCQHTNSSTIKRIRK